MSFNQLFVSASSLGEVVEESINFARWIEPLRELFERRYPKAPGDPESVHRAAIRAKALDTLRGLLPAATQSNVGMYGTGQAYEALLLRMRAHPLDKDASAEVTAPLRRLFTRSLVARAALGTAGPRDLALPAADPRALFAGLHVDDAA